MSGLLQFVGNWGHVLCAALFAVLAIWISRQLSTERVGKLLVAALSLTAIWSLSIAFSGVHRLETGVTESLRNCGWLVCLFVLPTRFGREAARQIEGARPLYVVLVLLLIAQGGLEILASLTPQDNRDMAELAAGAVVLRILWAIGALILVARIFAACSTSIRAIIAPVAAALVAMWSYDLVLYSAAFLRADGVAALLFMVRGVAMAVLAPVVALVMRTGQARIMMRTGQARIIAPSRALAWRGIGVASALITTLLLLSAFLALDDLGLPMVRAGAAGGLFMLVVGALLFLPATRIHARLKVLAAKHLFRHRYDYREQWMAFADTIGHADRSGEAIDRRVTKAMADITGSSACALLMPGEDGRFIWHGDWNWRGEHPAELEFDGALVERMRTHVWIVDLAEARAATDELLPDWLASETDAWALVPLIHFEDLIGLVVLTRPPVMRTLDWEDFDMLRAAGRQVASYIAEARGQKALEEARRFDEFNRRFAFILHDIKNLVSQIGLVARNAERHADNPDFRADMILTLKDCADRMNILLSRLSQHNNLSEPGPERFAVGDAINAVVALRGGAHALVAEGDLAVAVEADRAKLEQVLGHLVQNAVEASDGGAPVILRAARNGREARIDVIDHGCGMTASFLRDELFRPFVSTKEGGFGIGAYEARALIRSMGGSVSVESQPGKGSRFTITLPIEGRTNRNNRTERAA